MPDELRLDVLDARRDVAVPLVERDAALGLEVPLALGVELVREAGALVRPGDVDALRAAAVMSDAARDAELAAEKDVAQRQLEWEHAMGALRQAEEAAAQEKRAMKRKGSSVA